ncbi:MAG: hypothetical protein JWN85_4306 [Gammaproteobacteria bacterium]|nr:hypothetical protein [Gammaproteobacteria bacterium]
MSFRNDNHSRTRGSICKDIRGSLVKYQAFLYIHAKLPGGEFVALRMRLSDDHIQCHQQRETRNACGLQANRGQSKESGSRQSPRVRPQRA